MIEERANPLDHKLPKLIFRLKFITSITSVLPSLAALAIGSATPALAQTLTLQPPMMSRGGARSGGDAAAADLRSAVLTPSEKRLAETDAAV